MVMIMALSAKNRMLHGSATKRRCANPQNTQISIEFAIQAKIYLPCFNFPRQHVQ